jgi:outer membrane biosynthesis protein TonB
VNTSIEQRQQVLLEQVTAVRDKIAGLEGSLREVDKELQSLSGQRQRFQLLGEACDSLNKLSEMGAAPLFWGDQLHGFDPGQRLQLVSHDVAEFRETISHIEQARQSLLTDLDTQRDLLDDLVDDLERVREQEEYAKYDFVIEREETERGFRPMVMPWTGHEEDRRRLRKTLLLALLFTITFGGVPLVWTLPEPDKSKPVEVPERLARLVEKKLAPKPVETVKEAKKDEPKKDETKPKKKEEVKPKVDTTKPNPTPIPTQVPAQVEVKQARAKAESAGVLAFKDSLKDLENDMPSELGADARVTNSGRQNPGGAAGTRSLIVAQTGGSGGIANFAVSRGGSGNGSGSGSGRGGTGVGNGSGNSITGGGVKVARAQSGIAAGMGDADRPLSKGAGPARTDEEIQIVFDRYKAALYRIYNRELRNDPSLRGKMVLALTIEPDGRVSACRVQSTDLNSDALSKDIVGRVFKFNFGEKEGVPTTKILYPIDFLPAG